MAWDGSGTFGRTNGTQTGATTWANARDAGNNITASQHDTHDQDIADGIGACLTKNGESKPTADFKPNADSTYSLGSAALRWINLYLSGFIGDSSGNELLKFSAAASAVNEATVGSAATGKMPSVKATGGDTDISLLLDGKGAGGVVAGLLAAGVYGLIGGKITRSTGSSALTLAIKTHAGNDPSATEPVFAIIPSVSSNVLDGTMLLRKITAATSVVISSGSTLGQTSAVAGPVYTYLLDNAGTIELAASSKFFGGQSVQTSTAEGGAGAADTRTTLYSTTARSNVACVCVDRWKSTQTTAGTWAATTGEVQRFPFPEKAPTTQAFTSGSGTYTTPWDSLYLRSRLLGGGGGGAAVNTNNGSNGGDTTFSTFTASAGTGGVTGGGNGGAGGAASGGDVNIPGGSGQGGGANATGTTFLSGGEGGSSVLGGGGGGGNGNNGGSAAATNSGGGGGGAGGVGAGNSGGGGGAGGYVEAIIYTPAATYSYGVGAAGGGGAAGGIAGSNGAAGIVIINEFYS